MPYSSGKHKDDEFLSQFLSTGGDGSGTTNAIGNYAVPTSFFIQPPTDIVYEIALLEFHISDAGKFGQTEYANLGAALSTGIIVKTSDDVGDIFIITNGEPIKTNDDYFHIATLLNLHDWGGVDDTLFVTLNFVDRYGSPLLLDGDQNQKLEIILEDNFAGLIDHHFIASGIK